ncbi:hypothetical protein ACFWVC_15370 [Streptomyces sp. NPDC058691]|uniref:hypothetical protein n=1 Tax=Streptomyces sp. NPDC058691 TaxID=3346601 RepID=UPI00365FB211
MKRVLLLIASGLVVLEAAAGVGIMWFGTFGAGRVMCEWEAVGTQEDCSPTPYEYGLFGAAVLTALVMLCAAVVLGLPRLAARVPRRSVAVLLWVVVALNVYGLARWAMNEPFGGGVLLEDAEGLAVAAYVIGLCVVGMRRQAVSGPHRAAG